MVTQSTPPGGKDAPRDDTKDEAADASAEVLDFPESDAAAPSEGEGLESDDPFTVLKAEADGLRQEVAELKDQLLRALAETENVRNRAKREREETLRYAAAPLAKDLLPVADNLHRAVESVPAEAAESDERLKGLLVGVEMTEKALLDTLAKHGVARVDPLGEKLDPHRHEAMMEVQDPSKPSGTVAQVFEIGYVLHERLLRPARVAVAKGGPAPGAAKGSDGTASDESADEEPQS